MTEASNIEYFRHRLQRDTTLALDWFRTNWKERKLFRWSIRALAAFVLLLVGIWIWLARDLPDAEVLLEYETPLPTMVRDINGEIVHSYARERRVQLQFPDYPEKLIEAYLAAEDRTFFSHGGVDFTGTANAIFDYISKYGSGERAVGGSTITQQVAKNLLLGDEYSVTRKLKEMILAGRIEDVMTKQEILELYLNEIPLGRRSFGVQAAARAYFDKDVGDLELHEMAFLAILPKAPERYGRSANRELALNRRDFVLAQMLRNDFITQQEFESATAMPLGLVRQSDPLRSVEAGYFLEEVRRQLINDFGENAEAGPNSVYAGGLWVRTSLDPVLQSAARDSLRQGLLRYHGNRGWTGPIATIDMNEGNWASQLASSFLAIRYEDWRVGVVTQRSGSNATVGFSNGAEAPLSNLPNRLKVGDVIAVSPEGSGFRVRTVPEVSGGFLAEAPQTGRVLAMQGGFDFRLSDFNRATQADRQPGSTIKPFVYATGLDNGMTPATEVPDQTFCYYQGANLGEKCFRNFGGEEGGVHTMRWGLEQSRNLMTVHIAMEAGMPEVVGTFERMNIGSYEPYPAFALGAGDTTVLQLVNAYAALANHGRLHDPTVIDYVQDRRGKVIWRADSRKCETCNMSEWDGKPMPRFGRRGRDVIDARTAFQVIHMLQGVVTRGTAVRLRYLGLPLFGKTGTTSGPTNAWFVGGTTEIVAGVYIGHDQPRNLGGYVQGGNTAAPVFKQFVLDSRDQWSDQPPIAPSGIRMVRIDRRTGKRVYDGWPSSEPLADVIWEAFRPDTEPPRSTRQDEIAELREELIELVRRARGESELRIFDEGDGQPSDFVEDQGGIY